MVNCVCVGWATVLGPKYLLGNGHHPRCDQFEPHVRSTKLLEQLVNKETENIYRDIRKMGWGSEQFWKAYDEANYAINGKIP